MRGLNHWWRWAGILCLVSLVGCDRDPIALRVPEGAPPTSNRLELQVRLSSSAPAPDPAWVEGVPSAQVAALLVRDKKEMIAETASVDPGGRGMVALDRHPPGTYWVMAERHVGADSAAEAGLLIPVLAAGRKVAVNGATSDTLAVRPAERGSLLISEVSFNSPPPWETNEYPSWASAYFEILNNGDSTVHLDGMLLGNGYRSWKDHSESGHHSCSATEPMCNDPEGIWSTHIFRFPGRGAEHPVEPGSRVVVAVRAIDHSGGHSALPDLSRADYEFTVGSGVANNPDASDLEDVGPTRATHHVFIGTRAGWYLADPVDLATLPRVADPGAHIGAVWDYVRIPAASVRDAVIIWWDNSKGHSQTGGSPICRDPVHPSFDAIPGGFLEGQSNPDTWTWSAQRRMVRGVDGRMYGLDTNTSAIDFVKAPRNPGGPPPEGYREVWQW